VTPSRLRVTLMMVVAMTTTSCPVLEERCLSRYVYNSSTQSSRQQFITCSDMGALGQVPAFDISHDDTEMLLFDDNMTIFQLQSHAFAHVKARRLSLRSLSINVVDHMVFGGLEQIIISIDLGDNSISHSPRNRRRSPPPPPLRSQTETSR